MFAHQSSTLTTTLSQSLLIFCPHSSRSRSSSFFAIVREERQLLIIFHKGHFFLDRLLTLPLLRDLLLVVKSTCETDQRINVNVIFLFKVVLLMTYCFVQPIHQYRHCYLNEEITFILLNSLFYSSTID